MTTAQPPATTSAATPNQALHDDSGVLEPPPTFPYAQASGVASASARTSHTRVDTITEEGGDHQATQSSGIVSQDRQSIPDASQTPRGSSEQSPLSQQHPPEAVQESLVLTSTAEPGSAVPMTSTTTAVVDESSSQKASVQLQEVVPQTPQAFLTFLLVSGKRRTMSFEPETTIGRVKELIWNAWPSGECHSFRLDIRLIIVF
jgi:hypothetical protein